MLANRRGHIGTTRAGRLAYESLAEVLTVVDSIIEVLVNEISLKDEEWHHLSCWFPRRPQANECKMYSRLDIRLLLLLSGGSRSSVRRFFAKGMTGKSFSTDEVLVCVYKG